jgi:anti-sigma B factor antagonist
MTAPTPFHHPLEVERVGGITVATFASPEIMSVGTIDLIGRQLLSLVADSGIRQVLLNFHSVERLSTPLVGRVIELNERLKAVGGRLALCGIRPHLFEIFALMRLPRLLTIYATEQQALEQMQPSAA